MTSICYQVGGALLQDVSSYVTRDSDRQLFEALKAGEFCYVLNSRQMGKSSLMVRTLAQLQESGWKGIILDFSAKDTQSDQPNLWYNGIVNQLNNHFKLLDRGDFRTWLKERDFISPVERLGEFIETVLLPGIIEPIIIFVDEIDSTLGLPFTDDFFALIRACYNRRAEKPDYKRLTFALLGVAAPSELIGDTKRTPFNIGTSIDLSGFTLAEAQPLAAGLAEKSENPQAVLEAILYWTGGQPFLSQRLCQLVADANDHITAGSEASFVEGLVRSRLIENWESQDQQSHLKTIRDRVIKNEQKAGYLLELYRQTRQAGSLPVQNRPEEQELQLSGLVVKREGNLQVYNPIYAEVFNELWIDGELAKLRPYSDSFRAWVISEKTDKSRLLRGDALKEAEQWAKEKNPSAEDQDFISASRIQEREEEFAVKEKEAELERERQDKETAEKARIIEAEAKEKTEKRLAKANQRIGVGTLILVFASALSGVLFIVTGLAFEKAQIEQKKATEATNKIKQTQSELNIANNQAKNALQIKKEAEKQAKEAEKRAAKAKEKSIRFQAELIRVQADKLRLEEQTKGLKANSQNLQRELQAKAEEKKKAEQQISAFKKQQQEIKNKLVNSNNLLTSTQGKLKIKNQEFGAKEEELKTVTTLSQTLATQLNQKGKTDKANEALIYAGLYFQINDPKVKQAMLLAATSLAYKNLENWQQAEASINDSLKLLPDNINTQNPSDENVQTLVFSKSIEGDLFKHKNNKEEAMKAYNIAFQLLEKYPAHTNPFQNKVAILTAKDVESIHRNLLGLIPENSPKKDQIRASLKNHLLAELDYLMQQKKWQEADKKNSQFILFITSLRYDGTTDIEAVKNISCADLNKLDELWLKNSDHRYGFNVQKKIYLKSGNLLEFDWNTYDTLRWSDEAYQRFGDLVGWREKGEWLDYDKGFTKEYLNRDGHLPREIWLQETSYPWVSYDTWKSETISVLFLQRLVDCSKKEFSQ
jgi:hypothetical protein